MAGDTRAGEPLQTSELAVDDGLRPAEAYGIIRQRLEPLADSWGLEPPDLDRLARQMQTHTYAPGEMILPCEVRADFLGLIVRGQIAAYTCQQNASRQASILLAGSTFGDVRRAGTPPSDTALRAVTRCEVWLLRRADLQALSRKRQTERRTATFWAMLAWSTLVLVLCLVAVLALSLASVRQTAALVPMGVGQWCSQQGEGGKASDAFDRCVERAWTMAAILSPADANPLLALGTFYYEQGQQGAAEQSFEAAKTLAPDLAEIYNNLGLIYAQRGEHERAVAAFQQALGLEPGTAAIEHNLGLSLQASQAYEEALSHYELALAFGEPQASTLANMAIGYYETGQPGKAADAAQQVLQYDEGSAPAHTVLGAVALELDQPEEALVHLQRALALDEDYSQAYFYQGLAYKALDQPAAAVVAFEQALATAGDEVARLRIRRHLSEFYEAERQDRSP